MKALKFFLVSLFVMLGLAAQAQKVVVYKSDGTTDVYQANQVDSVVYNPEQNIQETAFCYIGVTIPTPENLHTIGTGTNRNFWLTQCSVVYTNNSGATSPIYYCFPTAWNMVFYDSDKTSEMLMADGGTFTVNNIDYTVVKGGGRYGLPNGASLDLYAAIPNYYYDRTEKRLFSTSEMNHYSTRENLTDIVVHPSDGDTYTVFVWPAEWGIPKFIHETSGEDCTSEWKINDLGNGYNIPKGYNYAYFQYKGSMRTHYTLVW